MRVCLSIMGLIVFRFWLVCVLLFRNQTEIAVINRSSQRPCTQDHHITKKTHPITITPKKTKPPTYPQTFLNPTSQSCPITAPIDNNPNLVHNLITPPPKTQIFLPILLPTKQWPIL